MSASEAAAESSSRARQDADAEPGPEPPQRRWVALVSTAAILLDGDERARAMPLGTNVELDLHDPPQPSYLVLHPRIVALDPSYFAHQPSAYILAADRSGRLLFRVSNPGSNDPAEDEVMYLCDTHARRATTLLPVPYPRLRIEPRPRSSVGLIADPDPRRRGHYLVVQLYPRESVLHGDKLLCYSTATLQWFLKPLLTSSSVRMRNPCAETGVLAHAGRLYWLALAYGVFVCDPFAATSHLRFFPLPDDCEMREELFRVYVAQRRRVAPSEGLLRYVEVRGLSYEVHVPPDVAPPPVNPSVWMWTLVDPEAAEPWRFEYEAPFAEVWAHESYVAAGLPHGEVPHVALVDPDDHGVVYFLQGSKLFGLNVRARRVVSCEDCSVRDDREIMLRNSRPILDAWELSPPSPSRSPRTEPSSPSPPDELDAVGRMERERNDRSVIQYVESWLEGLGLMKETDEGQPSSSG
ncbi:uncharacterized protein [Miscanthus floridulus]|uniref:uncharacterized protein n=1 Tax=Miscanthus floridulus TaxID=154761 RepID=UPI003458834F